MIFNVQGQHPELTPEQAINLDNDFFLGNPLGLFNSRISALLEANRSSAKPTFDTAPKFFTSLGISQADQHFVYNDADHEKQIALDALSYRHHAAEALLRFMYGALVPRKNTRDARSIWVSIALSPTSMNEVISALKAPIEESPRAFLNLFLPPGANGTDQDMISAETAFAWVNHAINLLLNNELSVNAANNKAKHGLAISSRNDVRLEFTTTPPNSKNEIPVSALTGGNSVPILNKLVLTYLSVPHPKKMYGLELTSLNVDTPVVLAETWMIASVYAAMFHVAGYKHFNGSPPENFAPYPSLLNERLPADVVGNSVQGLRTTVTAPPSKDTPQRPDGVFFHNQFVELTGNFNNSVEATVVDG